MPEGGAMFGKFFQEITGRPVSDFETINDVEMAAAKANGVERLDIVTHESNLINRRGNVFPFSNDTEDPNPVIDRFIASRS